MEKQQVLNRLIGYFDKNNLDVAIYPGISESGYDDKFLVCADWNPPKMERIYNFIARYFDDVDLGWSDEWTGCSDCGKAIRIIANSYDWEPSYLWTSDCSIACQECYEDSIEDIIETYKNDTNKAVTSDFYQYMEAAGFVCYSPDEYCQRFETGFYPGQNDSPQDVASDIKTNLPNYDYIFKIDSVGQFDVQWSVFLKESI